MQEDWSVPCHGETRSLSAGHHHPAAGSRHPDKDLRSCKGSSGYLPEHHSAGYCFPPMLHSTLPQTAGQLLGIGGLRYRGINPPTNSTDGSVAFYHSGAGDRAVLAGARVIPGSVIPIVANVDPVVFIDGKAK